MARKFSSDEELTNSEGEEEEEQVITYEEAIEQLEGFFPNIDRKIIITALVQNQYDMESVMGTLMQVQNQNQVLDSEESFMQVSSPLPNSNANNKASNSDLQGQDQDRQSQFYQSSPERNRTQKKMTMAQRDDLNRKFFGKEAYQKKKQSEIIQRGESQFQDEDQQKKEREEQEEMKRQMLQYANQEVDVQCVTETDEYEEEFHSGLFNLGIFGNSKGVEQDAYLKDIISKAQKIDEDQKLALELEQQEMEDEIQELIKHTEKKKKPEVNPNQPLGSWLDLDQGPKETVERKRRINKLLTEKLNFIKDEI